MFCVEGDWRRAEAEVTQAGDTAPVVLAGVGDLGAVAARACRLLALDVDGRGWPEVGRRDPVIAGAQARLPRRADNRCEACGCQPDQTAALLMEAHERFTYDNTVGVQRLRRLVWLCSACHSTSHFGLANLRGEAEAVLSHLQFVTGMSRGPGRGARDPGF